MQTSTGRRTTAYAVSALCAVALLSACGWQDGPAPEATATWSLSAAPPASTPTSPTATPSSTEVPSNGRARPTVMSGRVTSIKNGCTVFKNDRDAHRWVLIGETKGLTAGTAYVIQGVAMDSMDPNCSEGLPFQVHDATPREDTSRPLPPSTPGTTTLTGTVEDGVETGCRVIRTDEGTFVLIGSVEVPNGRVTVTGVHAPNRMSFCQQGPLFEVKSVTPVR